MNLLCDSFTSYAPGQNVPTQPGRWIFNNSLSIVTPGRFDGAAVGGTQGAIVRWLGKNVTTVYAGCAFYWSSGSATILAFLDSTAPQSSQGTQQVMLNTNSDGSLQLQRNGTNIGSASAVVLAPSAWHYIELGATIDPSAGTATVRVNGVTVLSLTGQNTRATSNSWANQIQLGTLPIFSGMVLDDLYVNDSTGSFNNTFLGDIKVVGSAPTGNGTATAYTSNAAAWVASTAMAIGQTILDTNGNLQRISAITGDNKTGSSAPTWATTLNATTTDNHATWTCLGANSAYKLVSENNADDDSSYLSDATVNDQSRFTFPAVAGAGVSAVSVTTRARKDDAGSRAIRIVAKSGATTGDNGSDLNLASGYQYATATFETDPNTSAAWTIANLNAAEFGVKTTV